MNWKPEKEMVEGSVDLLEILMHAVSQTIRLMDDRQPFFPHMALLTGYFITRRELFRTTVSTLPTYITSPYPPSH